MRQIKFRAWDKKNKHMFDVYAMDWASKGEIVTCHSSSKKYYPEQEVGDQIEFMQYTGLKDKNDKEIYEGDIVKTWTETSWDSSSSDIGEVKFNSKGYWEIGRFMASNYFKFEILGNIYQNKELLK